MSRWASLILLLTALAATAQTAPPVIQENATFCDGQYALCIKASCEPIISRDKDTNEFTVTGANCVCDVVDGWSMGPDPCSEREPVQSSGKTYLISTYSNLYNKTNSTLTCATASLWAWCYGAPCVVDEKNPTKAVCTCPVMNTPYKTLGGGCRQANCSGLWSAASYAEDWFANNYFAKVMTEDKLPHNPPAGDCANTPASSK